MADRNESKLPFASNRDARDHANDTLYISSTGDMQGAGGASRATTSGRSDADADDEKLKYSQASERRQVVTREHNVTIKERPCRLAKIVGTGMTQAFFSKTRKSSQRQEAPSDPAAALNADAIQAAKGTSHRVFWTRNIAKTSWVLRDVQATQCMNFKQVQPDNLEDFEVSVAPRPDTSIRKQEQVTSTVADALLWKRAKQAATQVLHLDAKEISPCLLEECEWSTELKVETVNPMVQVTLLAQQQPKQPSASALQTTPDQRFTQHRQTATTNAEFASATGQVKPRSACSNFHRRHRPCSQLFRQRRLRGEPRRKRARTAKWQQRGAPENASLRQSRLLEPDDQGGKQQRRDLIRHYPGGRRTTLGALALRTLKSKLHPLLTGVPAEEQTSERPTTSAPAPKRGEAGRRKAGQQNGGTRAAPLVNKTGEMPSPAPAVAVTEPRGRPPLESKTKGVASGVDKAKIRRPPDGQESDDTEIKKGLGSAAPIRLKGTAYQPPHPPDKFSDISISDRFVDKSQIKFSPNSTKSDHFSNHQFDHSIFQFSSISDRQSKQAAETAEGICPHLLGTSERVACNDAACGVLYKYTQETNATAAGSAIQSTSTSAFKQLSPARSANCSTLGPREVERDWTCSRARAQRRRRWQRARTNVMSVKLIYISGSAYRDTVQRRIVRRSTVQRGVVRRGDMQRGVVRRVVMQAACMQRASGRRARSRDSASGGATSDEHVTRPDVSTSAGNTASYRPSRACAI